MDFKLESELLEELWVTEKRAAELRRRVNGLILPPNTPQKPLPSALEVMAEITREGALLQSGAEVSGHAGGPGELSGWPAGPAPCAAPPPHKKNVWRVK